MHPDIGLMDRLLATCLQALLACRSVKADFHSAFFVTRATFLLFKLNSFPLHSTWKLRRQKKKVARATKKVEWKSALTIARFYVSSLYSCPAVPTYLSTTVLFGVATMKLVNNNTNAPKRKGTKFLHFLSQMPGLADASGNDIFNASATHLQWENV